jgi:microcystin-dependent protein
LHNDDYYNNEYYYHYNNNSLDMAICRDCLQNCDIIVQDKCVVYTGPDIPELDICQGDTLSQLEAAIIERLLSLSDGTGITLAELTTNGCDFMEDQLGVLPKTLQNVLQILWNTGCTLRAMIDEIDEQIANNTVFNTACLTGLSASPTRDQILQAAITLLCSVKTTVDAFPTTYVRLTDLTNLVTQIINTNAGSSQFNSRMVPFTAVPYFGPLTNFSAGGVGVSTLGYEKIYLCNGQNGTPDLRGRTVVGAIRNVSGGSLDAAVDPALSTYNPNWELFMKFGEAAHTITIPEIPAHGHTVTDPGHTHSVPPGIQYDGSFSGGEGGGNEKAAPASPKQTTSSTTGITIASTGGGLPHNNIQPSMGANYIMYIP